MDSKTGMCEEATLELNPEDAHIVIRCENVTLAKEYAKRLFPVTYFHELNGTTFIFKAAEEKNPANALGSITTHPIPSRWVTSRRVAPSKAA